MCSTFEYQVKNDAFKSNTGNIRSSQLDSEFDQHLASMKKYILELKDKKCNFKDVFENNWVYI